MLEELQKVFKAIGQNTRLKILMLVAKRVLCVCELEYILGITQSAVSQHMKILKDANLVKEFKEGQWVFYSLNEEYLEEVAESIKKISTGVLDSGDLEEEIKKLEYLEKHPIVSCKRPTVSRNKE